MVRMFLREGGREFQTDDPENARLVSYRSMQGRRGIKFFEPYLLRMYSEVSQLHTLNIITAYFILVVSLTGEV